LRDNPIISLKRRLELRAGREATAHVLLQRVEAFALDEEDVSDAVEDLLGDEHPAHALDEPRVLAAPIGERLRLDPGEPRLARGVDEH